MPCDILDWSSSRIHRVVRSTLAAEAASAAHAFDRLQHMRVVIAETLRGRSGSWQDLCFSIPGGLASDCHSLVDTCNKTGSSVTERRVGLDLADVRQGIERGDIMTWMPTEEMVADGLTKWLRVQVPLERMMNDGEFCLKFCRKNKKLANLDENC